MCTSNIKMLLEVLCKAKCKHVLSDYFNLHSLRHRSNSAPFPTSSISDKKNLDGDVKNPLRSDPPSSLPTLYIMEHRSLDPPCPAADGHSKPIPRRRHPCTQPTYLGWVLLENQCGDEAEEGSCPRRRPKDHRGLAHLRRTFHRSPAYCSRFRTNPTRLWSRPMHGGSIHAHRRCFLEKSRTRTTPLSTTPAPPRPPTLSMLPPCYRAGRGVA